MTVVGRGCNLSDDLKLIEKKGGTIYIGEGTYANGGQIRADGADVIIGRNCTLSYGIFLITNYGSHFVGEEKQKRIKPIRLGDYVWLGYGTMIRGGVTMGDFSMSGMGAVITKNVKPYEMVGGVPARSLGRRPDYDDLMRGNRPVAAEAKDRPGLWIDGELKKGV